MDQLPYNAKNVINGSFGQGFINNTKCTEITKCKIETTFDRTDVNMAGTLAKGKKLIGYEVAGEVTLNHVRSLMYRTVINNLKEGKDTFFDFTSKLADPDALGQETIVVKNACLDKLTLADWELRKIGEKTYSFSGAYVTIVDTIERETI